MNPLNNATTWILTVFESDLSSTQKLICTYLRTHMNDHNEVAWPSVGRIAAKCSLSQRTVFRELPKLCERDYLLSNGKSDLGTVRYAICTPDIVTPLTPCHDIPDTVSPELTKEVINTLSKGFVRPTILEIAEYCREKNYTFNPETFVNHYNSNGWKVGRNSMKCWKSACTNWNTREKQNGRNRTKPQSGGIMEVSISANTGNDYIG